MYSLLQTEFFKLKKFYVGYIAVSLMIAAGLAGGYVCARHDSVYNMNVVFSDVVSDTSFVFLMAIVSALFMGKDFSSRTICNEIKLGYSRFHILLSRMTAVCVFAALLHVIYVICSVAGFAMLRGFDTSIFCAQNAWWLLVVLIQLASILSVVVLITFLTRKMPEAVALSTVYALICCNILRNFLDDIYFTSSIFSFSQDSGAGNLAFKAVSAFIIMIIIVTIATRTFNKAEIK